MLEENRDSLIQVVLNRVLLTLSEDRIQKVGPGTGNECLSL